MRNEQIEPNSPKESSMEVQVDYDTARVYLPKSDIYVTFRLDNISDTFLSSRRTESDVRDSKMKLLIVEPHGLLIAQEEEGKAPVTTTSSDAMIIRHVAGNEHAARLLGVNFRELIEAKRLAWQSLIKSFQENNPKTNTEKRE